MEERKKEPLGEDPKGGRGLSRSDGGGKNVSGEIEKPRERSTRLPSSPRPSSPSLPPDRREKREKRQNRLF
jgi:hypothetical protein